MLCPMPTSTARYRFEFRVLGWSESFSRSLCGARCAFFIGLRRDGSVRRIYFAAPGQSFDGDRKAALADAYSSWFLYSPYEEPESGYVEWLGIDQAQMEQWLGKPFELADFLDVRTTTARDGWPRSWRAIV